MSDIKQIKVGDATYDIKDAPARDRLDTAESDIVSIEETLLTKAGKTEIAGFKNITASNVAPIASQGSDGDIWVVYE